MAYGILLMKPHKGIDLYTFYVVYVIICNFV